MNTTESIPTLNDAQQILASAVAHQVERMSKEELQALVAKALLELQNENAALKQRIEQMEKQSVHQAQEIEKLEAEWTRLCHKIARLEFNEKEWENFDPSQSTIPFGQTMAEAEKLLEGYGGDAP